MLLTTGRERPPRGWLGDRDGGDRDKQVQFSSGRRSCSDEKMSRRRAKARADGARFAPARSDHQRGPAASILRSPLKERSASARALKSTSRLGFGACSSARRACPETWLRRRGFAPDAWDHCSWSRRRGRECSGMPSCMLFSCSMCA